MRHLHKASGMTFECGELMEFPVNGIRKTYDMIVISLWIDTDEDPAPPIIVGYYFGEYEVETTDYYIDQWLKRQASINVDLSVIRDCNDIVEAYWVTNEDVLADDEFTNQRTKVQQTLLKLKEILEVTYHE